MDEVQNCYIVSFTYMENGNTSQSSFYFSSIKTGKNLAEAILEQIEDNLKSRNINADAYVISSVFNCGPNEN